MRRLAVLCLLAACHGEAAKAGAVRPTPGPRPGDPIPAGGEPMHGTVVEAPVPKVPLPHATASGRRRGIPHFAQIMSVVTDQAGTVALSHDALGSVRIWPALDGTREPQIVPARSPEAMAIGARADGSLAAIIDGTGLASLLRFDAEGLVRATATLSPDVPLSGVVVLPGGERVVAVRSDQRIALLDASGTELSRLSLRGGRVVAMHAAGDQLVAVIRRVVDDAPRFELRRLGAAGDALAWNGEAVALGAVVASLPHIASALSPDGALFAYMGGPPESILLRVVRTDTGAAIKLDGDVMTSFPATTMVGFTDDHAVEMASSNSVAWRIEIEGGDGIAISKALAAGTSPPAFASHRRIVGYQAVLALHADNGDVGYLGHRELSPSTGALADDGSSAAWVTSSGALVIQRFDGTDDLRIKGPADWFGTVAVVDADHVLAGRNNGQLTLFDSHTGAELASTFVSASSPWFMYEPKTKLIAVLRDSGVVWVLKLAPGATKPFGAPIAVGDGAQNFTLLDPDRTGGASLMTMDSQMSQRRYTWAELEDGVTASEMKKERVAIGSSAWYFDRAGHHYLGNGVGVEIREGAKLVSTITTVGGASGIWPSPGGDRVLIMDGSGLGPLRAFGSDGKELWSSSTARNVFAAVWSGDGKRAIVFAQGGASLIDGDTGQPVLAATGWAFSLTNELPSSFPPGVEPTIDVDF